MTPMNDEDQTSYWHRYKHMSKKERIQGVIGLLFLGLAFYGIDRFFDSVWPA
jgi:hypothetical protein